MKLFEVLQTFHQIIGFILFASTILQTHTADFHSNIHRHASARADVQYTEVAVYACSLGAVVSVGHTLITAATVAAMPFGARKFDSKDEHSEFVARTSDGKYYVLAYGGDIFEFVGDYAQFKQYLSDSQFQQRYEDWWLSQPWRSISPLTIPQMRTIALKTSISYRDYDLLSNNCGHFATEMYRSTITLEKTQVSDSTAMWQMDRATGDALWKRMDKAREFHRFSSPRICVRMIGVSGMSRGKKFMIPFDGGKSIYSRHTRERMYARSFTTSEFYKTKLWLSSTSKYMTFKIRAWDNSVMQACPGVFADTVEFRDEQNESRSIWEIHRVSAFIDNTEIRVKFYNRETDFWLYSTDTSLELKRKEDATTYKLIACQEHSYQLADNDSDRILEDEKSRRF